MTMDKPMNVCVLVGSLRRASFNGMLANALISLAPSSLKLDIVEIGQLPFYNEDLESAAPPAPWTAFRQRVKAADAVLFITPEYNRSVPAALKNALDAGRDRGLRRQSSSQAVARVSERANPAAA